MGSRERIMSDTIRLTMAQAVARFLTAQKTVIAGETVPIFGGIFAIFGHGNVAGVGEALYAVKDELPTYRGQNEQGMAHAAIAYAKASFGAASWPAPPPSGQARSTW